MTDKQQQIIDILQTKSSIKQQVFTNTFETFKELKTLLRDTANRYNKAMNSSGVNKLFEFRYTGEFLAELRVAGDVLIFYMHSNVFDFDRDHAVRKSKYLKDDPTAAYSGIINIYNFLADSFKYDRNEDLGYLIGRIFINKDKQFFVEGKRQDESAVPKFGTKTVDAEALRTITESAIAYSLQFDLLVPPYDRVKVTNVEHISKKKYQGQLKTGKRLGFGFRSDDIDGEATRYTGG
jgi:hypothetical protein